MKDLSPLEELIISQIGPEPQPKTEWATVADNERIMDWEGERLKLEWFAEKLIAFIRERIPGEMPIEAYEHSELSRERAGAWDELRLRILNLLDKVLHNKIKTRR